MIDITKIKNWNNQDTFYIKTEEGEFEISYQENLDLYWRYLYQGRILNFPDTHEFFITKENYFIYQLFDNLYNSIKEGNPFKGSLIENAQINKRSLADPLFQNGVIDWHSDEAPYDDASRLLISKTLDTYKVTFVRSKEDMNQGLFITFSVRFSNSGSRYDPFNVAFMTMYNKLSEYEPQYHQIHLEEIQYQQKKLKKVKN